MKEHYQRTLERHQALRGRITHRAAGELLKVSPATVRRIFREMADRHLALRYRGGLQQVNFTGNGVFSIPQRESSQAADKEILVQRAVAEFAPGALNMIHGGTTTSKIAKYLTSGSYLIDSVLIAAEISRLHPGGDAPPVILCGGSLDIRAGFLHGTRAEETIRAYCAETFITSVRGIDGEGLLETDDRAVGVIKAMMAASRRTVVVADHQKFSRKGQCRLCGWERVDLLITTRCEDNAPLLEELEKKGVRVVLLPMPVSLDNKNGRKK